ncbi:MAG: type II secretion system protein [Sedimentisphaerales bacterium]
MNTRRYKHGLSLVEMMIVVGVIALLATMVIGVASRIDTQAKEKGVESTFALLEGALEEYKEFDGEFPDELPDGNFNSVAERAAAYSEYLYGELYSIPSSRKILEKVSDSLIKNEYSPAGVLLNDTYPEIYDPWQVNSKEFRRAIDYIYVAGDNFPRLISAGPDKIFGTADDISSR